MLLRTVDPRHARLPEREQVESCPVRVCRRDSMSMRSLSARASVSLTMLEEVERGTRRASPGTLQRLSEALGVRLGDLMEAYHRWRCTLPVEYLTPDERRVTGQ